MMSEVEMGRFIQGEDRTQQTLFPGCLDDTSPNRYGQLRSGFRLRDAVCVAGAVLAVHTDRVAAALTGLGIGSAPNIELGRT